MARLNTEVRSHESPMDWQWQEGHGPTDTDSPFLKGAAVSSSHNRGGFPGQKRKSMNSYVPENDKVLTSSKSSRSCKPSRFPSEKLCTVHWHVRATDIPTALNALNEASLLFSQLSLHHSAEKNRGRRVFRR